MEINVKTFKVVNLSKTRIQALYKGTFATLVLARAHLETAVSDLSDLKNDIELCSRATKSNAFHLQQ